MPTCWRLLPHRALLLFVAGLVTLAIASSGGTVVPAYAASFAAKASGAFSSRLPVESGIMASEQYVFSVGYVERVTDTALTLRFDDGATEAYTLNGSTTIQSQNGDALARADLKVGEMVIVLSVENDPLARTIVSGGDAGFHDATPADIRGHDERACADCGAHAP